MNPRIQERIKALSEQVFTLAVELAELAAEVGVQPPAQQVVQRPPANPKHDPVNSGTDWSERDERRLRELYQQGRPVAAIAPELGRTDGAVYAKLYNLGLLRDGAKPRWSRMDEQRLKEAWTRGDDVRAIGTSLGRVDAAVYHKARRLGLPRRDAS